MTWRIGGVLSTLAVAVTCWSLLSVQAVAQEPRDGVDWPQAAIALEAAVDGMVGKDGDKFARRTFEQLQREGLPESNARAEIGRCFTGVLWELGHGKTDPEQATKRFHAILRRVQGGETTVSIWPDEEA